MKILVVTPFYKPAYVYGGPPRSLSALCEGLTRKGCDVEVLTTNANGDTTLDVETGRPISVDGVTVRYFPQTKILGRFFYSSELRRACHQCVDDFDYVYIYGIWNYPAIAAGAVCRRHDVPYIVAPKTGLMQWPLQQGWFRKRIYLWLLGWRYLDHAWAMHYTTEVEQQESEQAEINTSGFVVPNCMDFSEFDSLPKPGQFRSKMKISFDAPMLLFLGRLEPRKGIDISLRAFARVRNMLTDAQFIIAGLGEERYVQKLRSLTDELAIGDAVTFAGYVDATTRLEALVDADTFVLTSHTENFAMAAVEAMAAGTPVVLSNEVGVAEKAKDAGAGTIVGLDEKDTAEAIRKVLGSPSLREEMGQKGPAHVRETYGREAVAAQMIEVIQERQGTLVESTAADST